MDFELPSPCLHTEIMGLLPERLQKNILSIQSEIKKFSFIYWCNLVPNYIPVAFVMFYWVTKLCEARLWKFISNFVPFQFTDGTYIYVIQSCHCGKMFTMSTKKYWRIFPDSKTLSAFYTNVNSTVSIFPWQHLKLTWTDINFLH